MTESLARRRWLAQGAGLAAALVGHAGRLPAEETKEKAVKDPAPVPIIDSHQHLWDLSKFRLPWTKGNEKLGRSFLTSDYIAATDGLEIAQAVYMEVDLDPAQQVEEAEYVLDLCRRDDNPTGAGVVSGRPAEAGFEAYIDRFKNHPEIKGVRQILHGASTPPGFCLQPAFVRGIQQLGERGMSFDLCLRPGELRDGEKLVAQCKQTRFIVDHCGNGNVQETDPAKIQLWKDGMQALAQHDQVVCKISGVVVSAGTDWKPADLAPTLDFSMQTFGWDRILFGGDWPVCTMKATYRQWADALAEVVSSASRADRRKLFHDNAAKFYGLKPKRWSKPA
jgi:L-fuconolactonase